MLVLGEGVGLGVGRREMLGGGFGGTEARYMVQLHRELARLQVVL